MFSLNTLCRTRGAIDCGGASSLLTLLIWSSICVILTRGTAQAQLAVSEIPAEALQPRVARPLGEAQRRLERLDVLIKQEAWEEVCTLADELLSAPAQGWVAVGRDAYVGVRETVHRRLAELPAQAIAVYRQRVDPLAEGWLDQGIAKRDEQLLQRIVDEAFCSSAGDDALWALGEIALERGDYQTGRMAWRRINPATAGDGVLAYPDSAIELAEVRTRLALVSIRAGDFDRAIQEIELCEAEHPDAAGRLAGKYGNLALRLREVLKEAHNWPEAVASTEWPTLFANSQRTRVARLSIPADAEFSQAWSVDIHSPMAEASLVPQPITFPILAEGLALFSDASGLRAIELKAPDTTATVRTLFAADASPSIFGATMTADRGKAFAVLYGKSHRSGETPESRLVGIDLERDGALMFEHRPEEPDTIFVGTPVVVGSQVIVCALSAGQGMHASVACYDWGTSKLSWRQSLGWAFDAAQFNRAQPAHPELAQQEGVLYVNTNLGMIAAIRLQDGEPLWMRTYRRAVRDRQREEVTAIVRPPNPCIVHGSTAFAAPSDSNQVLAFDVASGNEVWSAPLPGADADLLAMDGDHLVLTGERLWRLKADTGRLDPHWGEDLRGGAGQGAIAGRFIFWPTAGDILLLDRATGRPTDRSIPLPAAGGAHLVISSGGADVGVYLVAAAPSKVAGYRLAESASDAPNED